MVVHGHRQTSRCGQTIGLIKKNFTGHMFNIKLDEKSYKMSFKALPVKIRSKNRQRGHNLPPSSPRTDRVKGSFLWENEITFATQNRIFRPSSLFQSNYLHGSNEKMNQATRFVEEKLMNAIETKDQGQRAEGWGPRTI